MQWIQWCYNNLYLYSSTLHFLDIVGRAYARDEVFELVGRRRPVGAEGASTSDTRHAARFASQRAAGREHSVVVLGVGGCAAAGEAHVFGEEEADDGREDGDGDGTALGVSATQMRGGVQLYKST